MIFWATVHISLPPVLVAAMAGGGRDSVLHHANHLKIIVAIITNPPLTIKRRTKEELMETKNFWGRLYDEAVDPLEEAAK